MRVLAFFEARGVTGALRNLLDLAVCVGTASPRISFEAATYWRSSRPGVPGPDCDDIQIAIDATRARGIPVHVLHERFVGDPRLLAQIRALVAGRRPDVVETHHVKSHFLIAASGAARDRRWLAVHHGYTATSLRTRAYNLLDRWSLPQATAVLTPCAAFADALAAAGIPRGRIEVAHNAASPRPAGAEGVADVRARHDVPETARLILSVGRLSREKGHSHLLAAFAREPLASMRDVFLVLVGDGPERRRLEALATRLRIDERVRFAGRQADVWPYYAAAAAVALPSDSEGSPNALLEAMALGRTVVATRVGGVPEIVTDQLTGLLVPRRDPAALAAALGSVLADPERAVVLGRQAEAVARRRFSVAARASALESIYARVSRA